MEHKKLLKTKRQPYKRNQPKPGRNSPCPCGSGKKYKNCHELQFKLQLQAKVLQSRQKKTA